MSIKEEKVIIIVIGNKVGFDSDSALKINRFVFSLKPSFFSFTTPDTFKIFFKDRTKNDKVYQNISAFIQNENIICDTYIGLYKGIVAFESGFWGKIKSEPIGDSINKAFRNIVYSKNC